MTFFSSHPVGIAKIGNEYKQVTDIFRRVYSNVYAAVYSQLETVTIPDGYTIEQVSELYYKSPTFHWVIMVVNNIIDIREEWPRSQDDLVKYCIAKYGSYENIFDIHHYESEESIIVQSTFDGVKTGITNIEYEEKLNDAKREIKMLNAKYLSSFVTQYQSLIAK
jgi:hypothetical protein